MAKGKKLDSKDFKTETKLRKVVHVLQLGRKERGEDDSAYDQFQPWTSPKLSTLVGRRVDILWPMKDDDERKRSSAHWCQGKVLSIVSQKNGSQCIVGCNARCRRFCREF